MVFGFVFMMTKSILSVVSTAIKRRQEYVILQQLVTLRFVSFKPDRRFRWNPHSLDYVKSVRPTVFDCDEKAFILEK